MSSESPPPDVPGATHRWIDVDGVRLHVVEAGTEHRYVRPSLVLLNGWPQHFWCWRKVIPLLSRNHHVLAIDPRGHGWSDAPPPDGDTYDKRVMADEIVRFLDLFELDRPVLVGHDWGGWLALLVAGRSPASVRGVVAAAIVPPWTALSPKELWRFTYQLVAGGPLGVFAHRALGQAFLKTVFRLGSRSKRAWSDEELAPYLERYEHPERAEAGRAMYSRFLRVEMPAALRRTYQKPVTNVPLLLLPGEEDFVLAPKLVRQALGPPNVRVETVAGAGHWIPEEQPEALADHVEAFVAELAT